MNTDYQHHHHHDLSRYDYQQSDLSRCVLGGLFAGIIGTIANLIFIAVYRRINEFYLFNALDVGTIIFGSTLLLMACGIFYYFFAHFMKRGTNLYRVAVFIITGVIVYFALMVRPEENKFPGDFRAMFIGTQIIIGGLAAFLIPYLFKHDSLIS